MSVGESKKVYNHIARFAKASWSKACFELLQTFIVIGFFYWLNQWWLSFFSGLAFLRLFVQFHDMGHLSFFPTSKANQIIGTALGGPVLTPYGYWKKTHDHHHQHSNDLDYLQTSQTCPLTLKEYQALKPTYQRLYDFFTSRPMMLTFSPALIWVYFITKYRRQDIGFWVMYLVACWYFGRLTVMLLSAWVGAVCGTYLFHMQHTFMPTTRISGKDYFENGLYGSSLINIPDGFLKWAACGIEYHHVHHLNAKVPSYRTRECHEANEEMFKCVNRLDLSYGFSMLKYNVWDSDHNCFRHASDQAADRKAA